MSTKDPEKQPALTGYQYGIAGAATGTVTRFLVQPLDVLKIRFQLQTTPKAQKGNAKYTSMFQAVKKIVYEEGAYGLWKGHIPAQFLSVVFGAVQFSTYEMLSKYLTTNHPLNYTGYEHLVNIGCGSVAGLAATVASFPFDVIKTHLVFQSEPKVGQSHLDFVRAPHAEYNSASKTKLKSSEPVTFSRAQLQQTLPIQTQVMWLSSNFQVYKGTLDAIRKIYQKEGPRGFSKGLMAACIQTTPMSGLVFCFHGIFTQCWFLFFQDDSEELIISTAGSVTTGLFSGLCAKTIVYPFDLMKKRLQIQGFSESGSFGTEMIVCRKISQCFIMTVKNEGFLGLFKGFTPTLIKSGATVSMYFTIYEKVCQFLQYSLAKR